MTNRFLLLLDPLQRDSTVFIELFWLPIAHRPEQNSDFQWKESTKIYVWSRTFLINTLYKPDWGRQCTEPWVLHYFLCVLFVDFYIQINRLKCRRLVWNEEKLSFRELRYIKFFSPCTCFPVRSWTTLDLEISSAHSQCRWRALMADIWPQYQKQSRSNLFSHHMLWSQRLRLSETLSSFHFAVTIAVVFPFFCDQLR